jgi:mRNA interferase RelE/StbE
VSYQVHFSPRAEKELAALSKGDQQRIVSKVEEKLVNDPRPPGVKALQGAIGGVKETVYRLRVGDFRVLYTVHDGRRLVLVIDLGNRREVYR